MKSRVVVLGAGFGGLELATTLSAALADEVEVMVIDKADSFVFGYSKLDVMFRSATPESVQLPYREFVKPGVRLVQETVTAIDPEAKRVTTNAGTGSCYIEFGGGRIGRVDIDFLSGPSPTGVYQAPSVALRADKQHFGKSRRARWFGRTA
jgi:NADH dehydrogenase FAD-containing subunit